MGFGDKMGGWLGVDDQQNPNKDSLVQQFMAQSQQKRDAARAPTSTIGAQPGGLGDNVHKAVGSVPGGQLINMAGDLRKSLGDAAVAPLHGLGDIFSGIGKSVGRAAAGSGGGGDMSDIKSMLMGQGLQGLPGPSKGSNAPPPMDAPPLPEQAGDQLGNSLAALHSAGPGGLGAGILASMPQRPPPGAPPPRPVTSGDILSDNDLDDQQRMMRPGQPRTMNKFR